MLTLTFCRPQDAQIFAVLHNMLLAHQQHGKLWCDYQDLKLPKRMVMTCKKAGLVEVWEFVNPKVRYKVKLTDSGLEMSKLVVAIMAAAQAGADEVMRHATGQSVR